ncbi:hypothetical protein JMJ35_008864 [Cladonia borealis]|uniref:Pyridoxamine kinase/Phosphomethylpyrimidine kinase domain-containing protein n=1 Tax=Cladonia borealis TaxID=184061 RepID=A0AA39UYB3_9LECA|nr:hypothetical protein JMJ35_008864 [Cladonia borealis]
MAKKRILVIAGSDSSGGAGLEGDQKVIAAHGCYAMTATTALTAQNTQEVSAIHHVPSDFVEKQIDACINDIGVDVVKIGMLASAKTVDVVASALRRHGSPIVVLDPVMVSTSGAQLLPTDAIVNLRTQMLSLTTILTPNIPEAKLLLENAGLEVPEIKTIDDIVDIAEGLSSLGPQYTLIKGGHLPLTKDGRISTQEADHHTVVDVLYEDVHNTIIYETDYLPSKNTHGTGCSLASALACNITRHNFSNNIHLAVEPAIRYVEAGIRTSSPLGKGNGPINHFHSMTVNLPGKADEDSSLRWRVYRRE